MAELLTLENLAIAWALSSMVVGHAAALAALTKNKHDDRLAAKARRVLDVVGFNFGFAKNADQ